MEIRVRVERAKTPEDLFGPLSTPEGRAKRIWRQCRELHPDLGGDSDLFAKAVDYWAAWTEAKANGGTKAAPKISSGPVVIAHGSTSNIHLEDGIVYKVARSTKANAMLAREAEFLKSLDENFTAFYPELLTQGMSGPLAVNTFKHLEGFYTLTEVRERKGLLDGRDYAWMARRILYALGGPEVAGYQHCAITPDNVMIHPEDHGVVIVGATFATKIGDVINPKLKTLEYDDEKATRTTDVEQFCKMSMRLISPTDGQYKFFKNTLRFPAKPATIFNEYEALILNLYGPRRFRKFTL